MVETVHSTDSSGYILLEPNRSASWKVNMAIIGFLALACGIVSLYMWSLGAWLVAPFAGLEVVFVFTATHIFLHRNSYREVIHFNPTNVTIEKGRYYAEQNWQMLRHWTRVEVLHADQTHYLPVVRLTSHGRSVEVGKFLNEEDKDTLLTHLSNILSIIKR